MHKKIALLIALLAAPVLFTEDVHAQEVEFEMMTWPEVKAALAAGKTTALVYTGGTEQRGPQNVNGGHTLMGREIVQTIALRLGIVRERISEQAIASGFKNVVIMGDHGGGQPATYTEVAKKLDAKYAPE